MGSRTRECEMYWWSMIFSENRYPLFGIMLYFGCTFGFPPGEPGGGMTFMAPPSGGG